MFCSNSSFKHVYGLKKLELKAKETTEFISLVIVNLCIILTNCLNYCTMEAKDNKITQ